MKNNWKILIGVLGILVLAIILGFIILPKTSFTIYQDKDVDKTYLENLKLKANVECLQNSQCLEGFECVGNKCVNKDEINVCQKIKLSSDSIPLEVGKPINLAKRVLTRSDLPYLLSNGKIVKIIDGELTEYLYSPVILIGDNKIERENEEYFIKLKNDSFIYLYRSTFSNPVDFSDKEIQGQILRILGKEYTIDSTSLNSKIGLTSENKKIIIEDGKKVKIKDGLFFDDIDNSLGKIIKGDDGNVSRIEISFNKQDKINIKNKEKYENLVFDSVEFSFNDVNIKGFADISIGGKC